MMNDLLFGYVLAYGLPLIGLSAFLSCLAVPIPTFIVMLTGGAFAASGDLVLWQVMTVAFLGAVLGDQTGFLIGRFGGSRLVEGLKKHPKREPVLSKAQETIQKWGGLGVFLSTWLFAPLGPWVNLIAGSAGLKWLRFTFWDVAGEAIWVSVYVSLGYVFAPRLSELAVLVGDWAGLISSGGLALVLGIILLRKLAAYRRSGK